MWFLILKKPFCISVLWDGGIKRIALGEEKGDVDLIPPLEKLKVELQEFLSGKRKDFSAHPLRMDLLTPFTKKVLEVVKRIPYGQVWTYSQVAEKIGGKEFSRAVGSALSRNPFPILIPCHRVIGKKGLGGFSQGIGFKRLLIELEKSAIRKL